MILTLTNFRCWEQKSFSFPDNGICLVHGRSGRGKSTVLNAIYFAISGKLKNITTFGKKSTKVILDLQPLLITRTRNPLTLSVVKDGVTYTDDDAQAVIDTHFGHQFACSSYIDQDNSFSFASMSPADKMEFLEAAVMQEFNIDKMRDRIRDDISSTKLRHAEWEGKLSSLRGILSTTKKCNVPEVLIDKNRVTIGNVEKLIDKVTSNLSVCERNSKVSMSRIRRLEDQQEKAQEWMEILGKKKALADKLAEIQGELDTFTSYADADRIRDLEARKDRVIRLQNAYKAREQLVDLDRKIEQFQTDLDSRRSELQCERSGIVDVSLAHIDILTDALRSISTLSEWDSQLEDFDKEKEQSLLVQENEAIAELRNQVVSLTQAEEMMARKLDCPECHTPLQFVNKTLIRMDGDLIDSSSLSNLSTLKQQLDQRERACRQRDKAFITRCELQDRYNTLFEKVEKSVASVDLQLEIDADAISEYLAELTDRKRRIENIETKRKQLDSDRTLISYRRDREQLVAKAVMLSSSDDKDDSLESVVSEIATYSEKHHTYKTLKNRHSELVREQQRVMSESEQSIEAIDVETLKNERDKFAENEEKIRKYREYLDQLTDWKRLWSERERYEKIENEISDASDHRDELTDRMRGLVKLRDHIKVAEKQCMEEFIQSLNLHASTYIEHFFEDEDLTINLRTVQESKTGKEKISLNFDVVYRGIPGDLSYLSGGERDRVTLAYTLALSEMIHPTVLMLDECISSLDAETTSKVLDTLRESYKGKLVLLISHQANLGFFDSVLEI